MPIAIIKHNQTKFQVGDKVQIDGRCPKYVLDQIRHNRLRTVVGVYYNPEHKCCCYTLGTNHWDNSMDYGWTYFFRSYQLHAPVKGRGVGRPRQKRRYTLRLKCTMAPPEQSQSDLHPSQVVCYSEGC